MVGLSLDRPDFLILIPHGIVLALAILTMAVDTFAPRDSERVTVLTVLQIFGYGGAIAAALLLSGQYRTSFASMAQLDDLAVFLIVIILASALLTVFLSATTIPAWNMPIGEYYALLAFSALGGLLVASSTDLVMVFVGIELSSLSIFVLAAFARRSRESIEGALKYFLLSAFATAIHLYGMAWTYGVTGTTNLAQINLRLTAPPDPNQLTPLPATPPPLIRLGFK